MFCHSHSSIPVVGPNIINSTAMALILDLYGVASATMIVCPKNTAPFYPVAFFIFFNKFNLPSTLANANNCATVKSFALAITGSKYQ